MILFQILDNDLRYIYGICLIAILCCANISAQAKDVPIENVNPQPTNYDSRAQLMAIEQSHNQYSTAFKLIDDGKISDAREIAKSIKDKSLMPYLELRIIEKEDNPKELQEWYSANRDKYGADVIYYKLQRQANNSALLTPSFPKKTENLVRFNAPRSFSSEKAPNTSASDIAMLEQIATLFRSNHDLAAIQLADTQGESGVVGKSAFFGGLAAFRIGRYDDALKFFEKTANWQYGDDFTKTAGAFWAARAAYQKGDTIKENKFLTEAAKSPFTFYGQLAMMRLRLWSSFSVPDRNYENKDLYEIIEDNKRLKNAIELFDIGQKDIAQFELRNAWLEEQGKNDGVYQSIAAMLGFDNLSDEIAQSTVFTGIAQNYPIPIGARPKGGDFVIDRALIYAIMRQESRFKSSAVSYAGARGLMQLMPNTAAWLAGRPEYRNNPNLLHNTEINISLGESYLEYVLRLNAIDNSVARALMAYNAGPGNVSKWSRRIAMSNDTLMFIEATPNTQAREYVKKVMTNLWIYHKRLGQNAPTLEKLAFDKAPTYEPQDNPRLAANYDNGIIKTALNH